MQQQGTLKATVRKDWYSETEVKSLGRMGLQQALRIGTWEGELIQRSSYKKCVKYFNIFMSFFVLPPGIPTSSLPILPSAESENLR